MQVDDGTPPSLLITGAYGTGKTTLACELVEVLADRRIPCAAIDIDWLDWAWIPGDRPHTVNDIMLANLRAMIVTFTAAGASRFVLAGALRTVEELQQVRALVPAPLRVLQLTVPLVDIERRLRADALSSRVDDLGVAAAEPDAGRAIADLTLANDGAMNDLARRVADWLGWS